MCLFFCFVYRCVKSTVERSRRNAPFCIKYEFEYVIPIQTPVGRFIFHKPSLLRHVHTQTVLGAFGQPQGNLSRPADCQKWVRGTAARPSFLSFQPCCPGLLEGSTNTLSVPSSSWSLAFKKDLIHLCCNRATQTMPFKTSLSPSLYLSLSLYPPLSLPRCPPASRLCAVPSYLLG